ncbi:HNH endonuclease signature motif containing protein [Pseudophaeobacter sp.]|uniref:HNH endonuclease n=1 Tax=Pseudophaeobacter sp. TaxID=1971739 RepID=UPI003297903D
MASVHETTEWRKLRPVILQRDLWTCQMCGALLRPGRRHKAAAVIDHKRPYDLRPDLVYDPANLWAICRDCHDRECRRIEDKARGMRQWTFRGADWIASEKAKCRFVGLDGATVIPTA